MNRTPLARKALANEQMRDLTCQRLQVDEIWSYQPALA